MKKRKGKNPHAVAWAEWVGRLQQSQAAGKPGKWPQGRFGQSRKKKIAARLNARRPLPGRRKNSSKS